MTRRLNRTSSPPMHQVLEATLELHQIRQEGQTLLGVTGWALFRSYGRIVSGPYSGSYVSGVPVDEVRRLLTALKQGQRIPVHLMHRHRSGNYEASELSLSDGRLLMHFAARSEPAE